MTIVGVAEVSGGKPSKDSHAHPHTVGMVAQLKTEGAARFAF